MAQKNKAMTYITVQRGFSQSAVDLPLGSSRYQVSTIFFVSTIISVDSNSAMLGTEGRRILRLRGFWK